MLFNGQHFQDWSEIAELLFDSGMTTAYPWLAPAVRHFHLTGNPEPLNAQLTAFPWLIAQARKRKADIDRAEQLNPFRPFPTGLEAQRLTGTYRLGTINPAGDSFGITPDDTPCGVLITGAKGKGKSYPVLMLIDQILKTTPEERGFNLLILQRPKNDADSFITAYPHLRVIEWPELYYNIWQIDDWDTPETKMRSACEVFAAENFIYVLTMPALNFAIREAFLEKNILQGSREPITFSEISEKLAAYLNHYKIDGFNVKDAVGRLKNRLVEFIESGSNINCRRGYPLSLFTQNDVILNMHPSYVSEFIARTVAMNILTDMQRCYSASPAQTPTLRTLVIIDEARWLFDVQRDKSEIGANDNVMNWFTTSRECGIGTIILTQEPESVSRFVTSNSAISITFPVYGESHETMKRLQNLTDDQATFMFSLAPCGEAIVRHPLLERPFLLAVDSTLTLDKTITKADIAQRMTPWLTTQKALCSVQPSPDTEPGTSTTAKSQEPLNLAGITIMKVVRKLGFTFEGALRTACMAEPVKMKKSEFTAGLAWLEEQNFIKKIWAFAPSGRHANYIALTKRAQATLGVTLTDPSHYKHSLYKRHVANYLKSDGCDMVAVEYELPGTAHEPKTTPSGTIARHRVDVFARKEGTRLAYEVQLTITRNQVMANVEKAFSIFGADELHFVTETDHMEALLTILDQEPGESLPREQRAKIHLHNISEFKAKKETVKKNAP